MEKINLTEMDAALAEEQLEPYPIEFMGEDFTIPNALLWDARVSKAIQANDLWLVFELMLGEGEFARMAEAGKRSRVGRLSFGHLERLMEAVAAAQGIGSLGESPAGEPTPATTGAPSNPIFNGSTGSTSPPASPRAKGASRRGASPAS